jgi:hypothetical protein
LQDIVLRSANALRRIVDAFPDAVAACVAHESVNWALLI